MPDLSAGCPWLDAVAGSVRELHERCCQPLRSPRMEKLAATIDEARRLNGQCGLCAIGRSGVGDPSGRRRSGRLATGGVLHARSDAVVYTETLENLSRLKRLLAREFALGH